jgi:hypothetical protein
MIHFFVFLFGWYRENVLAAFTYHCRKWKNILTFTFINLKTSTIKFNKIKEQYLAFCTVDYTRAFKKV